MYFLFDIFLPPTIGRRPPTRSNPCMPPLQHPFYPSHQLLVDCCVLIDRQPPKVTVYFLFDIFFASNLLPPTIGRRPPTRSDPHMPPLQHPFYRGRQLLVDCCVLIDQRPPKVTVYFLFDIFFASNLSPPTIGRHPPTRSNPRAPPL